MRPSLRLTPVLSALTAACLGPVGDAASGPVEFSSADVHVLGTSEAIALVQDLEVLSDGTVWVLNSAEPFFVGFAPTGELIASHGSLGGGPEEFRMPAGFVTGGIGGDAWTLDFVRHALIRVSQPAEGWAETPLSADDIPPRSLVGGRNMMNPTIRIGRMGSEIVLARSTGSLEQGVFAFRQAILAADLVAFDPTTGSTRDIVALSDVLADPFDDFNPTDGGFPLWYRLWAVCGDQIRVYDRVGNQLRGFTPQGEELAPIGLPPVPFAEVTPRQFAHAIFALRQAEITGGFGDRLSAADSARIVNEIVGGVEGSPSQLAAYLPQYVDFRCVDDGTLWLRPLDLDRGGLDGGPGWMRHTPDGGFQQVRMPERFDPFRFTSDRAWGVLRDGLDVASIAWIDLPGTQQQ